MAGSVARKKSEQRAKRRLSEAGRGERERREVLGRDEKARVRHTGEAGSRVINSRTLHRHGGPSSAKVLSWLVVSLGLDDSLRRKSHPCVG